MNFLTSKKSGSGPGDSHSSRTPKTWSFPLSQPHQGSRDTSQVAHGPGGGWELQLGVYEFQELHDQECAPWPSLAWALGFLPSQR